MTRVFVVDDHEVFRRGVVGLLVEAGFDVVGEASSGEEALQLAPKSRADIVLMDLHMPGIGGVETTRGLSDSLPVLVLTVSEKDEDLLRAIHAGARGYVLKNLGTAELVEAVRRVAGGESALSPEMAKAALEALRRQPESPMPDLSAREREVLSGISRGLSNRQIADELGLSEHTVKTYVERVYEKLGVASRGEAAAVAGRHGIS